LLDEIAAIGSVNAIAATAHPYLKVIMISSLKPASITLNWEAARDAPLPFREP
jgi:hypothetical protein